MTMQVTINADMGEGLGLHRFGNDDALMPLIDLANIACGFHAGDPEIMAATVRLAQRHGVKMGAHPGLPDLVGFGRRRMALTPEEVENLIVYQVGALSAIIERAGDHLNHIKPHGALWGMLAVDTDLMRAAAAAVMHFRVPFLGLAGTAHELVCAEYGVEFIPEMYVDMDYNADGTLALARTARATDPVMAAARVSSAMRGEAVQSKDDTPLMLQFSTICIHSDGPTAVNVAQSVRAAIQNT